MPRSEEERQPPDPPPARYHRLERTHAYISRGLGLEGLGAPRMRFLARPELVWIELVPTPRG